MNMYHLPPRGGGNGMENFGENHMAPWRNWRRGWGWGVGSFLPTESKGGDFKKLSVNQLPKNTEPHEGIR